MNPAQTTGERLAVCEEKIAALERANRVITGAAITLGVSLIGSLILLLVGAVR